MRWSLRKSSSQCHNKPVLVPPRKPPYPVKGIYDSQTNDLKTRVDIWTRIDIVPVDYGKFAQTFHLTMWLFHFITGINLKWYYVIGNSVYLLVCICLWIKFIIYRVPTDPFRWSCRGFGFIWQALILNWMLWTKNDIKVSDRKQVNAPSNMKFMTYLMNFKCQQCGIFEGLSYHQ